MRNAVFSRIRMKVVMLLAALSSTSCSFAHAQPATGCGPADAAAAEMRARVMRTLGAQTNQGVRTAFSLPTVPPDSVVQVTDDTLCARAAKAVAAKGGFAAPAVVYLFRAQNVYALFQPTRPEMTDYVHFLNPSMQYIGTGVR